MESSKKILYVDDEPKNLTSFKAVFKKDYNIYLANSAQEGIEIMERNEIQLVITDQRMPSMTGVEFLEKIARKYPDITRIILTGYSDMEAIINAINKGKVYRYMTKPWKVEELKTTIDNALEAFQLKNENSKLIESLKKTNSELDQFVYRAAHDLRAPVASLLGLINLAKEEYDIQKIKEYIDIEYKTVKKLDSFIQDIIDFSRNIHLKLQRDKIDFSTLIREILEDHKFYKNSESIQQTVSVTQDTVFVSDKLRLEIVLNNLISNAIRYSNSYQNQPFLHIHVKVNDLSAELLFEDNGQGISGEHLPKIFDMFYRATDKEAGSGLGLYIVKETIEKLNGSIEVNSEFSKGSSFKIEIPNLLNE